LTPWGYSKKCLERVRGSYLDSKKLKKGGLGRNRPRTPHKKGKKKVLVTSRKGGFQQNRRGKGRGGDLHQAPFGKQKGGKEDQKRDTIKSESTGIQEGEIGRKKNATKKQTQKTKGSALKHENLNRNERPGWGKEKGRGKGTLVGGPRCIEFTTVSPPKKGGERHEKKTNDSRDR